MLLRKEIVDHIDKVARELSDFGSLSISHYALTTEEQQELVCRGFSFTTDRLGSPHIRLSSRQRAEELRQKVLNKQ